jgi:hypothetical protein
MDTATTAILALFISAVLALLRIYEFIVDRRPKLTAITSLATLPEIGNTITLLNASKIPANIWYFELVWTEAGRLQKYFKLFRKVVSEDSPLDHEGCNITVPPHSQYSLEFCEADHFTWGPKLKHDIYLKVWMVGRRLPRAVQRSIVSP